jgi:hypothetical protein
METRIKQFEISADLDELLTRHARALGVSEAEVIRRAIVQALRSLGAKERDLNEWEAETAFALSRPAATDAVPVDGRGWRREELHDRADRLPH